MTFKKYLSIGVLLTLILCILISTYFFGALFIENKTTLVISVKIQFWIACVVLFLYARYIEKDDFLLWPEEKLKPLIYLLSIVGLLALITLLLTGLSILLRYLLFNEGNRVVAVTENRNMLLFVFSAFTAAVTEELIFRGYLLPRLQVIFNNKWVAIFLSSLVFGMAHLNSFDLLPMINPFIIGVIFSIFYFKYRSLATLIIAHLIIDLVIF